MKAKAVQRKQTAIKRVIGDVMVSAVGLGKLDGLPYVRYGTQLGAGMGAVSYRLAAG